MVVPPGINIDKNNSRRRDTNNINAVNGSYKLKIITTICLTLFRKKYPNLPSHEMVACKIALKIFFRFKWNNSVLKSASAFFWNNTFSLHNRYMFWITSISIFILLFEKLAVKWTKHKCAMGLNFRIVITDTGFSTLLWNHGIYWT